MAIDTAITLVEKGFDLFGGGGLSRDQKRARRNQYLSVLKQRGLNRSFILDNSDNWAVLKFYAEESARNSKWINALNEVVPNYGGEIKGTNSQQFAQVSDRFDRLKFENVAEPGTGTTGGSNGTKSGLSFGRIALGAAALLAVTQIK